MTSLLCGLSSTASATIPLQASKLHRCKSVVITPRSGNQLYGVKARGVSCSKARRALRRWGKNRYRPRTGPRGYRCRTVRRFPAGNVRLRCRAGKGRTSKAIGFNTGI